MVRSDFQQHFFTLHPSNMYIDPQSFSLPSRVDDEDALWDEYAQPQTFYNPVLHWKSTFQTPCSPSTLVIGTTQPTCAFLRATFMNNLTLVGTLVMPETSMVTQKEKRKRREREGKEKKEDGKKKKTESVRLSYPFLFVGKLQKNNTLQDSLNNKSCNIYSVDGSGDNGTLVVLLQYAVEEDRANVFTQTLLGEISADQVVVLTSVLDVSYNMPREQSWNPVKELDTGFLRVIHSGDESAWMSGEGQDKEMVCREFEAPNMITGVPAAVLTQCVVNKTNGAVFVALENRRLVNVDTLVAYEPLFDLIVNGGNGNGNGDDDGNEFVALSLQDRVGVYADLINSLGGRKESHLYL
eukprot:TRINITY_DN973_c1_g1_i2.p1 TRINITY_DN973_c1_g1~~TRINITY_DN973_c1_g1_i2.p1  ORF type:complete len:353 (-),score=78.72 TRINITY_DN973_c1_g1_i2:126-1184(-)